MGQEQEIVLAHSLRGWEHTGTSLVTCFLLTVLFISSTFHHLPVMPLDFRSTKGVIQLFYQSLHAVFPSQETPYRHTRNALHQSPVKLAVKTCHHRTCMLGWFLPSLQLYIVLDLLTRGNDIRKIIIFSFKRVEKKWVHRRGVLLGEGKNPFPRAC